MVKNPALSWDQDKIGKSMRAYIVLHNMIVENERAGYNTQYDTSEFEEGDVTSSSRVHKSRGTDIPPSITEIRVNQVQVRETETHHQLKNDLIENI